MIFKQISIVGNFGKGKTISSMHRMKFIIEKVSLLEIVFKMIIIFNLNIIQEIKIRRILYITFKSISEEAGKLRDILHIPLVNLRK